MDSERQAITDKINKLLALATSDNQHEAQLAAAKAMEMLMKYNVSKGELERAEFTRKDSTRPSMNDPAFGFVGQLLMKYFSVKVVRFQEEKPNVLGIKFQHFAFMGEEHNVEIAHYMGVYLMRSFNDCWEKDRKLHKLHKRVQTDYYQGMFDALNERLEETKVKVEKATGKDLVPTGKELSRFVLSQFPRLSNIRGRQGTGDAKARGAGQNAGIGVKLQRAVRTGSDGSRRQLT